MPIEVKRKEFKLLIIMRGLPWCGKSHRAMELKGADGVVLAGDDYWYQVVNPERPKEYSFKEDLLPDAHAWNLQRVQQAIWSQYDTGSPDPVIVDNTHVKAKYALHCVALANFLQISINIAEPTSDRWLEIRQLLQNKDIYQNELEEWAQKLAAGSVGTHNVPVEVIRKMIVDWENDITVEKILNS